MLYIKQNDYDSFVCIAGACPKSCCKGWEIVIDDESLSEYEEVDGEFRARLNDGINWSEGVFLQRNGRCRMLNDNDLCDLQLTLGEESLCYTCGMYPRHVEEYEGVRELSLSLSCPEAARMAVYKKEPYSFVEEEDDEEDDFDDFDYLMFTKLTDARKRILKIISDRSVSIFTRMSTVLLLSQKLQDCVDNDNLFEMDEVITGEIGAFSDDIFAKYGNEGKNNISTTILHHPDDKSGIDFLFKLERLDEGWTEVLLETKKYLEAKKAMLPVDTDEKRPQCFFDITSKISDHEQNSLENVFVLLIFTYFCGAVYDDEIYSKSAMCVYSVWWIYLIYKSRNEVENLDDLVKVIYSYAREVEHSDNNLNSLEEYFGAEFSE